ncbi:hypothetical protein JDV02_009687 [Purpureocillium takamizusanense]|uniref:EthD domain-containing protein n=1 Tax=Purpureocillium takamizusanense TaxID=2060973 RepID=A0A9Q8QQH1_9HYPO|nr:uncharacterized protein JDV02_009687 [Purpureocillium takamizusanense]UNI23895.1 hypothetical protein JDV02_009687 [Purpureocillium takamizusanense]
MEAGKKYLCLHILGFKKSTVSYAEYRDYMVNVHAPLVRDLLVKYGIVEWSMTHPDENSPEMFDKIRDGLFSNMAPFDVCVSIVMPDIETFVRFKTDPFFQVDVEPDHGKFADLRRSQMFVGWFTPLIKDGKVVVPLLGT